MFFARKTTTSILATFSKTLVELEVHTQERLTARDERLAAAETARKEAAEHDAEANASSSVASKLRALIG